MLNFKKFTVNKNSLRIQYTTLVILNNHENLLRKNLSEKKQFNRKTIPRKLKKKELRRNS